MNNHSYTPAFKNEAVLQLLERSYTDAEVSQ